MIPSKDEAMKILVEAEKKNPGPWKNHSIMVAKCAKKIAAFCRDLDEDKAYVLGLLHDIGRQEGVTYIAHVIDGYEYLSELGYDDCARIALTHSFSTKNIETYIGKVDVSQSRLHKIETLLTSIEYDDYDRLIQLCDSIALPTKSVPIVERMGDVKNRYGTYPEEQWNRNIETEKYFEKKSHLNIDHLNVTLEEDEFAYRKAEADDIDEVFSLIQKAIAEMDKNGIPQWDSLYPDREILLEDIAKNQMTLLIKGKKIAAVCTRNEECDEGYDNGHWKFPNSKFCMLHRLCVNPEFQKQGLARMFIIHEEKECKKLGYESIRLDSFQKNPFAVKLYNSMGYEIVGQTEFRKGLFDLRERLL